jgi:circadian clock protein KaiC
MTIKRITTGSAELDEVLAGGFPENSLNIVMGAPGTGKSILVEKLAFSNATPQRPALYLTTLSEPLEKFIAHGQSYGFFDAAKVGETVFYEDLGLALRERGTPALAEVVTELIAERSPKIIVIDSYKAISDLRLTDEERRTIMFDLASVLAAYDCTTFLVGEYASETLTTLPEFAVADGILQLVKMQAGAREQRFLRVEKLRGSASVPGIHAFDITGDGLSVYPRLLTPTLTPDYSFTVERVHSGIDGLDEMIADGFWRGSTTLIAGPVGSGKTIMGLQFIREGAKRGEPGIYVGFQENPVQLARAMKGLGWEAEEMLASSDFELMYRSPVEMQLDSVASELFKRVRDGKVKRIVIDAVDDLRRRSLDVDRFSDYMYALKQWFAARNVTCLMMLELSHLFEFHSVSTENISNLSDNVVLLRYTSDAEMARTIRIVKTRGSAHEQREHKLEITDKGMIVGEAR